MTRGSHAKPHAKYLAFFALAVRERVGEQAEVVGRVAFYGVVLLVFSRLWLLVLERGALGSAGPTECLWYLAITEWITLSQPRIFIDLEQEIRSGDITSRLTLPVSYVGSRLCSAAGDMAFRMLLLSLSGCALAYLIGGGLPNDPRGLLLALPLGVLAAILLLLFHTLIGLSAFWLQDVSPTYWIFQKMTFLFGGLLLPLDIYPQWLRAIALATPFSAALYGVGKNALSFAPQDAAGNALTLLVWIGVVGLAVVTLERRGLRKLEINGG